MHRFLIVCLLPYLLLTGCSRENSTKRGSGSPQGAAALRSPVLDAPPQKMREVLVDAYRLRPDRRFLLAVSDIHHILSGGKKQDVLTDFERDHWKVSYGGQHVGDLPEVPDFPDFLRLLDEWTRTQQTAYTTTLDKVTPDQTQDIKKDLSRFLAPNLISALRRIDAAWKRSRRCPELLHIGATSLVLLNFQWVDIMEVGDELPAKALAAVALAKSLGGENVMREECLLAHLLGYRGAARRIATSLPQSDAVRAYVLEEDEILKKMITTEARYLYLRRLARKGEYEARTAWRGEAFQGSQDTLAVIATGYVADQFDEYRDTSQALHQRTSQEVEQGSRVSATFFDGLWSRFSGGSLDYCSRFERNLSVVSRALAGPFADRETVEAYYRGLFYTGVYGEGDFLLSWLASVTAARRFLSELGAPNEGTPLEFVRWYTNLVAFHEGNPDPKLLVEDLAVESFGHEPLDGTFSVLKWRVGLDSPLLGAALRVMARRLDTRPTTLIRYVRRCHETLYDLRIAELYGSRCQALGLFDTPESEAWFFSFTGDRQRLAALMHDPSINSATRAELLANFVRAVGRRDPSVREEYEWAIQMDSDGWSVRAGFAELLYKNKEYSKARDVVAPWLRSHDASTGFDYIDACSRMAACYCAEKRYAEALAIVEPVAQSWQAGAMLWTARALDGVGRANEAERLYRAVVERYPEYLSSNGALAAFLWRHSRHDEAAVALRSAAVKPRLIDWELSIAPYFSRAFSDQPAEEAVKATTALFKQRIGAWEVRRLARGVAQEGNNEVAFEIISSIPVSGPDPILYSIDGYRFLKAWKGKPEALDWIRKRIPENQRGEGSDLIFLQMLDSNDFDLLWDLSQPYCDDCDSWVWLMRAAASARLGADRDPHRTELVEHFNRSHGEYHNVIGRYLLRLCPEKEVFALPREELERSAVAFFVGLRKASEGHYEEAHDWLRVAVECGIPQMSEYQCASRILDLWQMTGRNLAYVAEKRL